MRNPDCCLCVEREGRIKHQSRWFCVACYERFIAPPEGGETLESALGVADEDEL